MTKRGLTIAENFAAGAKTPLLTNDELTLGVLVNDAMKDPDVAYVIVSDQDGNVLAHSDARAVKTAVVRPTELEPLKNRVLVQTYKTPQGRHHRLRGAARLQRRAGGRPLPGLQRGGRSTPRCASARNQALLITLLMVLARARRRGGPGRPALAPHLPARAGHAGHRRRQLQRRAAGDLPRRARRADRVLQPDGAQPAREGDDQARVHALRGARGGRGDPEGPGEPGAHRRAARGHRALLRRARLHADVGAAAPRRRWCCCSTTSTR